MNFKTLPPVIKTVIVLVIAIILAVVAQLLGVDVPVIPDFGGDPTPTPSVIFPTESPSPDPTHAPSPVPTLS